MSDIQIPIRKFHQLLNYMQAIGLDPRQIADNIGLSYDEVTSRDEDHLVPGYFYSLLYKESVQQMQTLNTPLPWAAGIGSDAFRLMCYCMISAKTLGEALQRAQEFDQLLFPMIGHKIELIENEDTVKLLYHIKTSASNTVFAPDNWDRSTYLEAVAKASGLEVWFGFCGWLIAQSIDLDAVRISAPFVSEAYQQRSNKLFHCTAEFNADENALIFSKDFLDYRLVHNTDSLELFLDTGPHQLWAQDQKPASTSAAIKSLIGSDFKDGLPSFEAMAESMHMSPSTLRRQLHKENTSYQKIKDECRRRVAIELLCVSGFKTADVGDQLGFTDTSSFIRSFRNWTGMTPKAFKDHSASVSNKP
jgi:AraC-like DNA-binding protein